LSDTLNDRLAVLSITRAIFATIARARRAAHEVARRLNRATKRNRRAGRWINGYPVWR